MNVTLAGISDGPETPGQHPHTAGGEVGHDGRGQADESQFSQRNACAPVGKHLRKEVRRHNGIDATPPPAGLGAVRQHRSSGQSIPVHTENVGDRVSTHWTFAQNPGLWTGEVEDGRGRLLLRAPAVEVDVDQIAELVTSLLGGRDAQLTDDELSRIESMIESARSRQK